MLPYLYTSSNDNYSGKRVKKHFFKVPKNFSFWNYFLWYSKNSILIEIFFLIFYVGKFRKDKTEVKIEFFFSFLPLTLLEMVEENKKKKNILQTFFETWKTNFFLPIIFLCGNFFSSHEKWMCTWTENVLFPLTVLQ